MNKCLIAKNSGQGMQQGLAGDRNQKLEPGQMPVGSHCSLSAHFPGSSQLLPPLSAASVFAFSTPVSELKTLLVSHSLRIRPEILPLTFKSFMTCPPNLSHVISFNLMGLFPVPPSIQRTHLWVIGNSVSSSRSTISLSPPQAILFSSWHKRYNDPADVSPSQLMI